MAFTDRKISVMIAGVQKAATSSLYYYMQQHPEFTGHGETEFSFFVMDDEYKKGIDRIWKEHYPTVKGYTKFIAKSAGIIFSEEAVRRLKEHNREMKIIIVLRNPVERAYSAYWYARKLQHEPLDTFEEALFADSARFSDPLSRSLCAYMKRGYYADQIEMLYRYFTPSSVKIILQEDLKNTGEVLKELFEFAGADVTFRPDDSDRINKAGQSRYPTITRMLRGSRGWKKLLKSILPKGYARKLKKTVMDTLSEDLEVPAMNPETRRMLVDHYKPHNTRLQHIIGRDLSQWK